MPKWTKDQLDAITARKHNLLVSAAAGSGKTAVLVERIIKLITEDLLDIDKLLIVTFTKAAAGEMRDRILEAISRKIEEDNMHKEHLKKQLTLLNRASITTLHSFCIDVIRRNFHVVGLDHSFRVADITERNILLQEALDEVFEEEYKEENENFIKLVEGYAGAKNDIKLQSLVLKIYSFIQSKPDPKQWLEEIAQYFNIEEDSFYDNIWVKTIIESIKIELEGAYDLLLEALQTCRADDGPTEYQEAICDDIDMVDDLAHRLCIGLDEFFTGVRDIEFEKFKSIRGARKEEIDQAKIDEVKEIRNIFKKNIIGNLKENILKKGMDKQIEEMKTLMPIVEYLNSVVNKFADRFNEKKLEKNILDFNDLEHYTLKILENEYVKEAIRDKYEYIFVDEYQDSNIVQETIINRIKRDDNLFLVGDVKQSIYRFRMADPSIFIDKYNTYEQDTLKNKRIILSQNFRSREEVLLGVNYIFKNIMRKEIGDIEYNKEAYLYKGMDFKPIDDESVEINILPKKDIIAQYSEIDSELADLKSIELEAKAVANRIKKLIGKKTYKPKENGYKSIDYKDIVVLLRATRNVADVFVESFIEEGIPVYADDNQRYFQTVEIRLVLDVLSLIDNKRNDLPLISVMKSPIGGFSIDELIQIRINSHEKTFYESLVDFTSDIDLQIKIKHFLGKLDEWSNKVRYQKLDEFIWDMLISTGYYYYVGAMKNGAQKQANLRVLISRANQFEQSSIKGLFNFIRFIDKMKKSGSDMSEAKTLGENENLVRIMSIHKSKGLEFPVVICAGLGKKFNMMDTREEVLLHKELGIGPKFVDIDKRIYHTSLPQAAIKKKIKLESLAEEMRILYVGLTRAVDKLILFGSVDNINKSSVKWCRNITTYNLMNSTSYIDWIMMTLTKHQNGTLIRELANKCGMVEEDVSSFKINIISLDDLILNEEKTLAKDKVKEKLLKFNHEEGKAAKALEKRFNFEYPNKESIFIPAKITVTDTSKATYNDIKLMNHRIPSLSNIPRFASDTGKFTATQKGTIIHYVMQHLDINNVQDKDSISAQIDAMITKEMITREEAQVINIKPILSFFNSDIGKRMKKSSNILRETPFVMKKESTEIIGDLENCKDQLYVQGIIDCCFEEDSEFVLIDYKTDYVEDENIEEIKNRYKKQIELYKEAFEKIREVKVKESYIYLLTMNKAISIY
ncbi:helicase-exonuclease AddAB subunit AddA [Clostridiaceae bacterium M8S5]|nr:helicase-exonuclease AddAB subunit AddA [Clostridiaceae bacterium M8S5]